MACYSPLQIAQEVKNQGGSNAQAWVAAALVTGIESNGCTDDANPSSTACGLFQFLDTTWASNGGTAFSQSACGASMQQQVAIFLKASAGSNFYPWAPDLGGSYNSNPNQPAATTPQPGSKVANAIAGLADSLGHLLGNVPTNWADAGAVGQGLQIGQAATATTSTPSDPLKDCAVKLPFSLTIPSSSAFGALGGLAGALGLGGPDVTAQTCLLTKGQLKWVSGVAALVAGAGAFTFGVVMLAAWGYDHSGAKQAVGSTARKIGIGGSLLAGQPEVAGALAATGGGKGRGKAKAPRTVGLGPSARPQQSGETRTAGRRESREIERQFREAQRQGGPIGPRGASPTSTRIAERERRGRVIQGGGRPRTPEQRARARQRASEPF